MRTRLSVLGPLGLSLGLALAACFDDPVATDGDDCPVGDLGCSCLANATCFGTLECVQGVCLEGFAETTGDGDGDGDGAPGDGDGAPGDGDGDGEPAENVVVDLFMQACAVTTTWSAHTPVPTPIPCDQAGDPVAGGMVRYPELTIGDDVFTKVIGITPPPLLDGEVRGIYSVDDVNSPSTLEFRAEVLLRCAPGIVDCQGQFALAIAENTPNGLYAEIDDRDLLSGQAPISIVAPLSALITLSEPAIGLVGQRTVDSLDPSPEILIVNPRLVSP